MIKYCSSIQTSDNMYCRQAGGTKRLSHYFSVEWKSGKYLRGHILRPANIFYFSLFYKIANSI